MDKYIIPASQKDKFLSRLSTSLTKVESPKAFEPLFIMFNKRINNAGFYGMINGDYFWIRRYDGKIHEAKLPGRYYSCKISKSGEHLLITAQWRFTLYWPVVLLAIYIFFVCYFSISVDSVFLSFPIYLLACLVIFAIGIGTHEKEECQVQDLLKNICTEMPDENMPNEARE